MEGGGKGDGERERRKRTRERQARNKLWDKWLLPFLSERAQVHSFPSTGVLKVATGSETVDPGTFLVFPVYGVKVKAETGSPLALFPNGYEIFAGNINILTTLQWPKLEQRFYRALKVGEQIWDQLLPEIKSDPPQISSSIHAQVSFFPSLLKYCFFNQTMLQTIVAKVHQVNGTRRRGAKLFSVTAPAISCPAWLGPMAAHPVQSTAIRTNSSQGRGGDRFKANYLEVSVQGQTLKNKEQIGSVRSCFHLNAEDSARHAVGMRA